jgi:hypothetical protein
VPERRRGYRLIVALTVLNSLMFLGYFFGPPAWRYTRKRIDDRQKTAQARLQLQQARQTARVAAQKQLADTILAEARLAAERKQRREALEKDLKACREHAFPPDTVAFEQDPEEADRLWTENTSYVPIGNRAAGRAGHPPVRLPPEPAWERLRDAIEPAPAATRPARRTGRLYEAGTPIFLHERRAADGPPRIVVVLMRAENQGLPVEEEAVLHLRAGSLAPEAAEDGTLHVRLDRGIEIIGGLTRLDFTKPRTPEGKTPVTTTCMLRLMTGRPDPVDESQFTFDAYSDGRPVGRIVGRLHDDGSVTLEPEGGRVEKIAHTGGVRWRPADWRDLRRQRTRGS